MTETSESEGAFKQFRYTMERKTQSFETLELFQGMQSNDLNFFEVQGSIEDNDGVVRVVDQHIGMGRMLIEYGNSVLVLKPLDIDKLDVENAMKAGKVIVRRFNKDFL
jgi:hypothetical protein